MKEQSQTLPILGVFSLGNPCHHFRKSLDIKELAILLIEIDIIVLALGAKGVNEITVMQRTCYSPVYTGRYKLR
jgi:hypothetical protein